MHAAQAPHSAVADSTATSHMIELALTFDDVLLQPNYSEVLPADTELTTTLGRKDFTLAAPILSAAMDTVTEAPMAVAMAQAGGLGILHKNLDPEVQARAVREVKAQPSTQGSATCDKHGRLRVGAAVGVGEAGLSRAAKLVAAEVDLLVVDTAHGHTKGVLDTVRALRERFVDTLVMAGNVASAEGTLALIAAGAQAVKVGIGPGSICTTRQVAGVGVPQLTALMNCAPVARAHNVALIADGGIRRSADIVKALAAGASAVMLGGLLAGAEEAPGAIVTHQGRRMRAYRGMGSMPAMKAGSAERYFHSNDAKDAPKFVAEGVEALVPIGGPVRETLAELTGGVRSGMGYCGARTLALLFEQAHFLRISPASVIEGGVHDVTTLG